MLDLRVRVAMEVLLPKLIFHHHCCSRQAHFGGKRHQRRLGGGGGGGGGLQACQLCRVTTTSAEHMALHLAGRAHQRKLRILAVQRRKVCLVQATGAHSAEHSAACHWMLRDSFQTGSLKLERRRCRRRPAG